MLSTCGFCKSTRFDLKEVSPHNSKYKMYFVQCSACGVPVGVTDFYNTHNSIEETNAKIKKLEDKLNSVEYTLSQIVTALNSRR